VLSALAASLLLACAGEPDREAGATGEKDDLSDLLDGRALPPTAHPALLREFREDERAPRSDADGAGTATVTPRDPVRVGERGSWTITFRAGPAGIAPGGAVVLQVSPFWEWSDPQTVDPGWPGYTRVETHAQDTQLLPEPCGAGCLRVGIVEGALPANGEIDIHYGGEGTGAARVDRFAEAREEFFLRVDGDGDGVTAPIANPPTLDVLAGAARALHVVIPSTARVGDQVFLGVGALDGEWNAALEFEGQAVVVDAGGLDGLPERIAFGPEHASHRRIPAVAARPGTTHVELRLPGVEGSFRSNPVVIEPAEAAPPPRILWADLHGHTGLSDGTGTPAEYLRYARDFAGLDIAAVTDHDHFGLHFLDREPALWEEIRGAVDRFHEPGRFVALLG
jgi:hypothetical protein